MKKILLNLILICWVSASNAQFGTGTSGDITFTDGVFTPTATDVVSVSGLVVQVTDDAGFAVNDEVLMIQCTGFVSSSNNGNWIRARITNVFLGSITLALQAPTLSMKTFDTGIETIQLIKLEQYDNIIINGKITPLQFNGLTGGIIPLIAKKSISFTATGQIDVTEAGYPGGLGGAGGIASALLSTGGANGLPGANGGTSGTGGLGSYGGGNGGATGNPGALPTGGAGILGYRASNSLTTAKNASIPTSKIFVMGDGGNGSEGIIASNGGGAGGGGADKIDFFDPSPYGTTGVSGTLGINGADGIGGSRGGGLVFLFAQEVIGTPTYNHILIKAKNANIGNVGADGGNGGKGGTGAGRTCLGQGGGGGGGNGADGTSGSNGGSAGAGGAVYSYRNSVAPSGGSIFPIAYFVNNGIAYGGAGGAASLGGEPGVKGGDENTTSVLNCGVLGLTPCSTAHYMDTMYAILATTGPGTYLSPLIIQSGPNVTFIRYYTDRNDSAIFSGIDLIDCNDSAYSQINVHLNRLGSIYDFKLYSNNDAWNSVVQGLYFWSSYFFAPNTPANLSFINDNAHVFSDQILVHDCYAMVCPSGTGNPGAPGAPGLPGLDGEAGFIDEDFFTGTPLNANTVSLKSKFVNEHIQLNWQLTDLMDIVKFEVEKSTNGVNFEKLYEQAANASNTYNFIDINISNANYYKIKAIKNDGTFINSNIELVQITNDLELKVMPTIVTNEITVLIPNKLFKTIAIRNTNGQLIEQLNIQPGKLKYKVSTEAYPSGVYYVQFGFNVVKFIKQ